MYWTILAGLKVGDEMLVWIQNKDYTLKYAKGQAEPESITGASFKIEEAGDGAYSIEWWDTREGKVISRDRRNAQKGELQVPVPAFSKDIACKIIKSK